MFHRADGLIDRRAALFDALAAALRRLLHFLRSVEHILHFVCHAGGLGRDTDQLAALLTRALGHGDNRIRNVRDGLRRIGGVRRQLLAGRRELLRRGRYAGHQFTQRLLQLVRHLRELADLVRTRDFEILAAEIAVSDVKQAVVDNLHRRHDLVDGNPRKSAHNEDQNNDSYHDGHDELVLDCFQLLSRNAGKQHADDLSVGALQRMIAAEVIVAEHFGMAGEFLLLAQHLVNDSRRSLRAYRALAALALERGRDAGVAFENRDMVARQTFQIIGYLKVAVDFHIALVQRIPLDRPRSRMQLVNQRLHLAQVAVRFHAQREIEARVRVPIGNKAHTNCDDQKNHVQSDQCLRLQFHAHSPLLVTPLPAKHIL